MNESLLTAHPVERPPLAQEHLPHRPHSALEEIFPTLAHCDIFSGQLSKWLQAVVFVEEEAGETNQPLKEFYDSLFDLIKALHCIHKRNESKNAMLLVRDFCERYSQVYVRRELRCFVHAVMDHAFSHPDKFLPGQVLELYEEISALTETAYILCEKCKNPPD